MAEGVPGSLPISSDRVFEVHSHQENLRSALLEADSPMAPSRILYVLEPYHGKGGRTT